MLATVNVRQFLPPWLILAVPRGLGVTQMTAHIQQLGPCMPLPSQASQEQTHSESMVGASSGGRQSEGHSQLHHLMIIPTTVNSIPRGHCVC